MSKFRSHPTPNPDSLKITYKGGLFIESGLLSFSNLTEAADHPLGSTLFNIAGVANVFIVPDFLTITKTSDKSWKKLWPQIQQALLNHYSSDR